jgi:hypothetical protein
MILTAALATAAGQKQAPGPDSENAGEKQAEQAARTEWPEPLAQAIMIEAEGEVLHYQKRSSWEEADFSEMVASASEFRADARARFERSLESYGVQALDVTFEFRERKQSITMESDITGAMYGTNSYDFHWLLGDLPFDLYQFEQHDKELVYEGTVSEVPTEIRLILPYSLSHCHEHVWPR